VDGLVHEGRGKVSDDSGGQRKGERGGSGRRKKMTRGGRKEQHEWRRCGFRVEKRGWQDRGPYWVDACWAGVTSGFLCHISNSQTHPKLMVDSFYEKRQASTSAEEGNN
jgi:hypothetical protein